MARMRQRTRGQREGPGGPSGIDVTQSTASSAGLRYSSSGSNGVAPANAATAVRFLSGRLEPPCGKRSSFFLRKGEVASFLRKEGKMQVVNEDELRRTFTMFTSRRSTLAAAARARLKSAIDFSRLRPQGLDAEAVSLPTSTGPSREEGPTYDLLETVAHLRRVLGYLEWPRMLEKTCAEDSLDGEDDSFDSSRPLDDDVALSGLDSGVKMIGRKDRKKRKAGELEETEVAIAYVLQPLKIVQTNACLLGLTDGLHESVLRGRPGDCSSSERFEVRRDFDGSVCLALHSAASAAFDPSRSIFMFGSTVAEKSVDLSSSRLIKTLMLTELLLGENGRSCFSSDDRPTMRASFMRGMKRAIRKYVSQANCDEIREVIKLGASASTFACSTSKIVGEESDEGASDSEEERDY